MAQRMTHVPCSVKTGVRILRTPIKSLTGTIVARKPTLRAEMGLPRAAAVLNLPKAMAF